uniref:Galectin n=1 Tax=Steinernema glaseri TaxID=37863 RepID=A0A1I8AEB1_9BILA
MDLTLTKTDFLFQSSYDLCSFSLKVVAIENGQVENVEQPMRILCEGRDAVRIFVEAYGDDINADLKKLKVNDVVSFENVSITAADKEHNNGATSKTVLNYHCQSTMMRCQQTTALKGRHEDFGVTRFNARLMEIHLEDGGDFLSMHLVGAKDVEFDVLTEGAFNTNFFYQKFLDVTFLLLSFQGSIIQLSGLTLEPWDNGVMAILRGDRAMISVTNSDGRVQHFSPSLQIL